MPDLEQDPLTNNGGSYMDAEKLEKPSMRTSNLRWFALALACSVNFGSYFCFDNPQAVQKSLEKALGIEDSFGWLYSVYSMPNIVLPFFGGLIIDKIGVRVTLITFAGILVIGQSIVALGVFYKSFALMLVGRVVFGLGGECLGVAQSSVTAKWFMGKELAFAMGATLCVSRLGSSLNSFLSPKINDWSGLIWLPFVIGAGLCVLSWFGVMTLAAIDKKADQEEGIDTQQKPETEKFKLSDFKKFNMLFYLLLFNCFFIYGAFFGLNNNLNKIMQERFGFKETTAGNFIPIVYICSAVITPFFGLFTDRYGKRIIYMIISSAIFFADHLIIAFLPDGTEENPQYGMVGALLGVGLFYSTYAAVFWPCVPLVVQADIVGTAYGIITSLQNCMLAIIPLVIDKIHAETIGYHKGYFWTEIFLAGVTLVGFFITSWIFIEDFRKDKKLHKPSAKNKEERSNSGSFLK